MPLFPAARRCVMGWIMPIVWVTLTIAAGVPGARAFAQTTVTEEDSIVIDVDTSKSHDLIRKRISTFT
ncbi:MAG: hypothetical protein ABJB74_19690, partial [Gemmatimonas sp.]